MSRLHAIDGDEPLFDFDGLEGLEASEPFALAIAASALPAELFDMSHIPNFSNLDLSSFSASSTPAEVVDLISRAQAPDVYAFPGDDRNMENYKGKGKAISRPMDILPRDALESHFDLFSFSAVSPGPSRERRPIPVPSSSFFSSQTLDSYGFSPGDTPSSLFGGSAAASYATEITTPGSSYTSDRQPSDDGNKELQDGEGKGKSRAEPPILPPLSFNPTGFTQGETNWPIEDCTSPDVEGPSRPYTSSPVDFPADTEPSSSSCIHRYPSRTRSYSSLSVHSAKSLAARSVARAKVSFIKGKPPSNLARKLLFRSCDGRDYEQEESAPTNTPVEGIDRKLHASLSAPSTPCPLAPQRMSPAIDDAYRVFVASDDEVSALDLFELMLPKEIKLQIFHALLRLHEDEGDSTVRSSSWTALKASKNEHRWVGKERGFVELVQFSRVSKSWKQLVFDGQLWASLDLRSFPIISSQFLLRLASSLGSFVRTIDLTGHTHLTATSLLDITKSFCIRNDTLSEGHPIVTQLTDINLSGCSAVTTGALHDILIHSPLLVTLNLKGMFSVTNETCRILAAHCPAVVSLDLSRCHKMDVDGIISFITPYQARGAALPLKVLRLSGLRLANDRLLALLGRHAPNLEVLDLSGARELRNSAFEAFVSCADDGDSRGQEILLTSREAGREPGDATKYRRRLTKLRQLSLSYCVFLSDTTCLHLAHAVPRLELLELAGIGSQLRDEGLVHLLNTTPLIRRLDLDEACDITDVTIATLTPQQTGQRSPGSQLEQLNLSYAVRLSNDALLSLIRACPRLKRLELDNTRVSGTTVNEFVRLARNRQAADAELVVVDCRTVCETTIKDLVGSTRTRKGWRSWHARKLNYLDARDNEALGIGTDECDEKRVVLKSFYSWQTVDAVEAEREKQRKANKNTDHDVRAGGKEDYFSTRSSSKWWSPGARRTSGSASPISMFGTDRDRESCIIM